jgi:hypothetical protein
MNRPQKYEPPSGRNTARGGGNQQNSNNNQNGRQQQRRNNEQGNGRPQRRGNQQDGNLHGILHVHELEQIQNDIRNHQLLIGSSDLLNRLNVCF